MRFRHANLLHFGCAQSSFPPPLAQQGRQSMQAGRDFTKHRQSSSWANAGLKCAVLYIALYSACTIILAPKTKQMGRGRGTSSICMSSQASTGAAPALTGLACSSRCPLARARAPAWTRTGCELHEASEPSRRRSSPSGWGGVRRRLRVPLPQLAHRVRAARLCSVQQSRVQAVRQ